MNKKKKKFCRLYATLYFVVTQEKFCILDEQDAEHFLKEKKMELEGEKSPLRSQFRHLLVPVDDEHKHYNKLQVPQ